MNFYELFISVGEDGFRFIVTNSQDQRCLLIEEYQFFSRLKVQEILACLHKIYDTSLYLKANFWFSINVIVRDSPFTLIPWEYFDENQAEKYLKFTQQQLSNLQIKVNRQKQPNAMNVFGVDNQFVEWFSQAYPNRNINFLHQTQVFIEGIQRQNQGKKGFDQIHVYIEPTYFIIGVWQENKLTLMNIYHYRTAGDFIYFLLFVMDELRLSREDCPVRLYGKINSISEIYKNANTYLNNVRIYNEKPSWLKFNSDFENISDNYYFDLYSAVLCRF
jgi:hypothetical protein